MQTEILLAGFGGQGVMFAGQLLAYTAMDEGYEVTWIPSYGPEMRGGTAHCFVVISDHPIGSPIVRHPQIALVFNAPSFEKYEPMVAAGGLLISNSSLISRTSTRTDISYQEVPASTIAEEIGDARLTNVIMLGAMLQMQPIFPHEVLAESIKKHLPQRHQKMLALNLQALEAGAHHAQSHPT